MRTTRFDFLMGKEPVTDAIVEKTSTPDLLRLYHRYHEYTWKDKRKVYMEERELIVHQLFSRDIDYLLRYLIESPSDSLRDMLDKKEIKKAFHTTITSNALSYSHRSVFVETWNGTFAISEYVSELLKELNNEETRTQAFTMLCTSELSLSESREFGRTLLTIVHQLSLKDVCLAMDHIFKKIRRSDRTLFIQPLLQKLEQESGLPLDKICFDFLLMFAHEELRLFIPFLLKQLTQFNSKISYPASTVLCLILPRLSANELAALCDALLAHASLHENTGYNGCQTDILLVIVNALNPLNSNKQSEYTINDSYTDFFQDIGDAPLFFRAQKAKGVSQLINLLLARLSPERWLKHRQANNMLRLTVDHVHPADYSRMISTLLDNVCPYHSYQQELLDVLAILLTKIDDEALKKHTPYVLACLEHHASKNRIHYGESFHLLSCLFLRLKKHETQYLQGIFSKVLDTLNNNPTQEIVCFALTLIRHLVPHLEDETIERLIASPVLEMLYNQKYFGMMLGIISALNTKVPTQHLEQWFHDALQSWPSHAKQVFGTWNVYGVIEYLLPILNQTHVEQLAAVIAQELYHSTWNNHDALINVRVLGKIIRSGHPQALTTLLECVNQSKDVFPYTTCGILEELEKSVLYLKPKDMSRIIKAINILYQNTLNGASDAYLSVHVFTLFDALFPKLNTAEIHQVMAFIVNKLPLLTQYREQNALLNTLTVFLPKLTQEDDINSIATYLWNCILAPKSEEINNILNVFSYLIVTNKISESMKSQIMTHPLKSMNDMNTLERTSAFAIDKLKKFWTQWDSMDLSTHSKPSEELEEMASMNSLSLSP